MTKPAKTVDEYLSRLDTGTSKALEQLRKAIKSAASKAEEVISYRIPLYKYNGYLVAFKTGEEFCSFITMSGSLVKAFKKELEGYEVSGTTIHFQPGKPLPSSLVRKLVKARMKENEEKIKNKLITK